MVKSPGQSVGQRHWGRSQECCYLLLCNVLAEPRQIKRSAFVRLTVCQCPWRKGQGAAQQKRQLLGSSRTEQQEGKRWHLTCSHGLRVPLASDQQALLVKHMSVNNMHFFQLNWNTVSSNVSSHKRLIDQACKKPHVFFQSSCINEVKYLFFTTSSRNVALFHLQIWNDGEFPPVHDNVSVLSKTAMFHSDGV